RKLGNSCSSLAGTVDGFVRLRTWRQEDETRNLAATPHNTYSQHPFNKSGEWRHINMTNFTVIEQILRNRTLFYSEIRDNVELWAKCKAMLISCITFFALYGAVMGASHSLLQALSSFVKLPILFIVTFLICAPSLYFFNLLFGSKQTLLQHIALIL